MASAAFVGGSLLHVISGGALVPSFPNIQMLSWPSGKPALFEESKEWWGALWKAYGVWRDTDMGSNPASAPLNWVTVGQLHCPRRVATAKLQTHEGWEKIPAMSKHHRRSISRIYKELLRANQKRTGNSIEKGQSIWDQRGYSRKKKSKWVTVA